MAAHRNEFLDHDLSEESDLENGYDSEAAEISKGARLPTTGRNIKRRKLSHSGDDEGQSNVTQTSRKAGHRISSLTTDPRFVISEDEVQDDIEVEGTNLAKGKSDGSTVPTPQLASKSRGDTKDKGIKPGVIYLSSLPPYLKPSALRNLLIQRGFEPITRLFLTPASKAKAGSKKNSRQLYTEGWVEFAHKKTAKRCAETLNAQIIGGRKGGFYHDDLWNMKYLRGMGWSELMAGIREERREEEGRRDEERRTIATETKRFIEGVEQGRQVEGIKRKRSSKAKKNDDTDSVDDGGNDVKRTWRQFKVKGTGKEGSRSHKKEKISDDAKEVLGKIF